ncbi:hypothetical protein ACFL6S_26575 [Candidatus Poribacteria bacterium]
MTVSRRFAKAKYIYVAVFLLSLVGHVQLLPLIPWGSAAGQVPSPNERDNGTAISIAQLTERLESLAKQVDEQMKLRERQTDKRMELMEQNLNRSGFYLNLLLIFIGCLSVIVGGVLTYVILRTRQHVDRIVSEVCGKHVKQIDRLRDESIARISEFFSNGYERLLNALVLIQIEETSLYLQGLSNTLSLYLIESSLFDRESC